MMLILLKEIIYSPPEDEQSSINMHLGSLQTECDQAFVNSAVIAEKLERTISHRFALVRDKSVSEVLDVYPCLRIEKEVNV